MKENINGSICIKFAKKNSPSATIWQKENKRLSTILRCQSAVVKQPQTNVYCDQRGLDSGKALIRLYCKMSLRAIFFTL